MEEEKRANPQNKVSQVRGFTREDKQVTQVNPGVSS